MVEVFGKPARESRSVVGYLTQTFSLYPDLSVNENIRYVGDLRRVPHERDRRARVTAISRCSIWTGSRTGWRGN